ncbi:MAG: histidinol-phosphate transaminase [Naasia sp.]
MPRPPVRLRPEIAALPAYRQGKPAAAGGYKLSSNENPFDPLPGVLDAIRDALDVNRYPDASAAELRGALAEKFRVALDEVHVGAGSVSLLTQFITAAAGHGDEVVHAWRSFEAYPGQVIVAGASAVRVPLRADGGHDLSAMAAAITDRTRIVLVCTPNNPTGVIVTRDEFATFMDAVPSDLIVLLDEAYAEFVRDPAAVDGRELLGRYPNLVILRTFSKAWGLAGLRLGYAIGPAHVLDAARAAAIPLSVTGVAQAAGLAALRDEDELLARVDTIVERRGRAAEGVRALGIDVPISQGNFIWLPLGADAEAAGQLMEGASIAARVFPGEGVRVSIGEEESVDAVLRIAEDIVDKLRKSARSASVD